MIYSMEILSKNVSINRKKLEVTGISQETSRNEHNLVIEASLFH
jgi:hypothetical protein